MRATSAAGPRGSRRPARSGPGLPRGTCRHRPLAARSRAAPPPRRARARSYPARSRAAAASTAISCVDIHQTYHRSGLGPAMAEFIALVSHQGPIPPGFADQPAPPRRFRVAGPGRRLPQRPALRAEHHVVPPLPARFRRAPRGIRPRRHRRRSRIQHDDRWPRGPSPWPDGSGPRPPPSRAATADPRRRIRQDGRSGRLRRHRAPGPHQLIASLPPGARLRPLLDRREPPPAKGRTPRSARIGQIEPRALRASPGSTVRWRSRTVRHRPLRWAWVRSPAVMGGSPGRRHAR